MNMAKILVEKEVHNAMIGLNENSASGPDGFSISFFRYCWEIVGEDITRLIQAFFYGQELTKFFTHTNLILIPKREVIKGFVDLRLISLSSFINKIISRVIHDRLVQTLPKIISHNQLGFVKGRNIVENVLLAQEIIRDINKRSRNTNVVIKLDMEKAYDRVSWFFLTKVLRKFGFSETLIDMI